MKCFKPALVIWMLLIIGQSVRAQEPASRAPALVAVKAGQVLDVRSGKYQERQIILIEGALQGR